MEVRKGYKQTEIGVFPAEWEVKPLKKISPSQSVGLVINPSTYFDNNGTIPMLVGSNVNENHIDWMSANRITASSNKLIPASQLTTNDLVTVRVGEPGTTAVVPPELDGCNCASMMIVRKHTSFSSQWLCYVMNSRIGLQQIRNVQYGTAQKQFNISDAINFIYPFPPLPEQQAIAAALSDVDALLNSLDALIAKKRFIKQGAMQELLTGKKRLPGFSGEWEVKTLGEIASFFSGGTPSTGNSSYYGGEIPWITSSDLNNEIIHNVDGRITKLGLENSSAKMVNADTLLIALYGATAGVTAITRIRAAINQAVLAIVPSKDNHVFLYYILKYLKDWIITTYTQGGQPNLSGAIVKSIEISLPNPNEQTAIAEILSDMDAEISALEQKREKTRLLKQGMMQELLTGRIRLL